MATRGAQSPDETTKETAALAEPSQSIAAQFPAGQRMGPLFGCALSIALMSGDTTLCITELKPAGPSGH